MTDHFQLPATVDSPCGGFARFSALMKGKLYIDIDRYNLF